jgi:hypothetical protein
MARSYKERVELWAQCNGDGTRERIVNEFASLPRQQRVEQLYQLESEEQPTDLRKVGEWVGFKRDLKAAHELMLRAEK